MYTQRRHSREDALGPFQFVDLYLAACDLNGDDSTVATTFLLLTCRCKFRKAECLHFWEEWYLREFGIIRLPEYEPCKCQYCWKRADDNHENKDPYDSALDRHYQERFSTKNNRVRFVPVTFSPRVVAAVENYLDTFGHFDKTPKTASRIIKDAAKRSHFVDPDAIDFHALRATGDTYWAFQNLPMKARAEIGGHREAELGTYSGRSPIEMTNMMRRAVGLEPIDLAGYDPIITDPRKITGEPFDPLEVNPMDNYDPTRGLDRIFNPRSDTRPADVNFNDNKFNTIATDTDVPSLRELKGFVRRLHGRFEQTNKDTESAIKRYLNDVSEIEARLPGQQNLTESFMGLLEDERGSVQFVGS